MDVGSHGLACPGPEEYAALALFMQCEAEKIDAILTEQTAEMELLTNRAAIIAVPVANAASAVPVNNFYDTVLFDNSAFLSLENSFLHPILGVVVPSISIGSPLSAMPVIPYLRGLYEIGIYSEAVASAPAIGTLATANVEVWDADQVTLLNSLESRFHDQEESTGTTRINGKLTIELTGTNAVNVTVRLSSASGGIVTWDSASSLWVRYLGPNEQVETI